MRFININRFFEFQFGYIINMSHMFDECENLIRIKLPNFNYNNITNM